MTVVMDPTSPPDRAREDVAAREAGAGPDVPVIPTALRVAYIAGYGRSGTTVLDIALGQHGAVFGAGEITALTRHVWSGNEYCACGCLVRACPFWSAVVGRWLESEDSSLVERYAGLQAKTEGLANLARGLVGGRGARRAFEEYGRQTAHLLRAIAAEAGAAVVVDSSKLPGRAFALSLVPGVDLRVVHVVRDGRGVAWSLLKRYDRDVKAGLQREIVPRPVARTALRWALVNLAVEALCRRLGPARSLRLRYEDLTGDPEAALGRVGRTLGLDLGQVGAALHRGEPMGPGHQIAGNRLRMGGAVRLARDDAWRSDMPADKRATFDRLCGWLLRRYGYP